MELKNLIKRLTEALTPEEIDELAIYLDEGKGMQIYDGLVEFLVEKHPATYGKEYNCGMRKD